ncbi:MAG TPA: sulfite exporter TauE/SafE family protein [Ignavibacteria bacterium]|nr:sulfite exporter TauE/SafE family protein [Ignavibacteria bacterium]
MLVELSLIIIGFAIGTFGTLVGAGGGFVLMPVLLLMFPDQDPEILTSISLAVVFFNAASGSLAYSRMKKIDYRSGLIFSIAAVPGAIAGSYTVKFINREIFNIIFGIILIVVSVYLFFRSVKQPGVSKPVPGHYSIRHIIDSEDNVYAYAFEHKTGIFISVLIGFVSSLLGIGGGIIHVPAMVNMLNFPVHIATATSHFVLAIMALAGSLTHILDGSYTWDSASKTLYLGIGVIAGAQLGAKLSKKMKANFIIKALAIALCIVGVRIFLLTLIK